MTKLYLTWYECMICKKLFKSYFEIIDDSDKQFLIKANEENTSRGLFDFIIRNERECRRCRKGQDLEGWIEIAE